MKNGNVKSKVGLGWFGTLAARCLIIFINFCHLFSGSRNNNILQLGTILNNEASMLESFFQIFGMVGRYFSEILAIPKIIN
jgi:hypothetical protein